MKSKYPFIILISLTIAFFLPSLTGGRSFLFGDNLSHQVPTLEFWKQEVLSGRIPLWNPYILGGVPFLADLSHNSLAPTNVLYLFLSIPIALSILAIFYVSLAAIFTYLFVQSLTKKVIPSMFSAVVFAFSGTMMSGMNDINSLQGIAFIPVIFFFTRRWIIEGGKRPAFWLITSLTLQFFSSHPQYSYYTWIFLAAYIFFTSKQKFQLTLLRTGGIFLATISLSAVQLIPFLEFSQNAFRPTDSSFSTQDKLEIIETPRLILANFYGSWQQGSSWGPGSQLETGLANSKGFVGIFALVFAGLAIIKKRSKETSFWTMIAVISLLLSIGNQSPLYQITRSLMPFFSKFRSPIRILSIYSFAIAVLAGIGLSSIKVSKRK